MCIKVTIPSGWQQTCLKKSGRLAQDATQCSLFCSPNGKTFKTLDEVHKYNCELERIKLEKEEFMGKNTYSFVPNQPGNNYHFVKTTSQSNQSFNNNHRDETVSCKQCKFQFSTAKERLAHMTLHSQQAFATITCKKCQKVFQSMASLEEHLKKEHAGPPGPPIQMGKVPSALDLRLQNYSKNSNNMDAFSKVFQSKNGAENMLKNITGLSFSKKTRPNVLNPSEMSQKEAKAELRRRYIDACESVKKEKGQSSGPGLPPGPVIVKKQVEVRNTPSSAPQSAPLASPPGPALQNKIPISGVEMLKAMEAEAAKKKKRPSQKKAQTPSLSPAQPVNIMVRHLVSKTPKSPLHKIQQGRIIKKKDNKPLAKPKFRISVNEVCRFFNMSDYPIPVTDEMKKSFQDYSRFETFCMPLLATVNPFSDPLQIKTLCRAKWREVLTSDQSPLQYYNRPRNNMILVNMY